MRRTITIPTFFVLAALALTGCSAMSTSSLTDSSGGVAVPQSQEFSSDGSTPDLAVDPAQGNRQVITTGYVTITVDSPTDAAADAARVTEQSGGRVDGRTEYAPKDDTDKGSATLTLRIPSDKLTATLDKLRELGTVEEVSLNSQDVTTVTQDLDARIDALTGSVARLTELLATADSTDTLLKIETTLTDQQGQLESLQSQRRYYADQVSLSTVTLNLVSTYDAPTEPPATFVSGLIAGWNAFVAFFAGLLVALGVLLPWIVFAGIITFVVIYLVRWNTRRKAGPTPPAVP